MIRTFGELADEEQEAAGGKAATLSRLYRAGYPIPDGFIILPGAFRGDDLCDHLWPEVERQLARLHGGSGRLAFAVRSSALGEDSAHASFAGEFETVLGVDTDEAVAAAIGTVRRSRKQARVEAYSRAQGLDADQEVAVIVQQLVPAELSGVLFTADPLTGSRSHMVGNFVPGLGDKLVSGQVNSESFYLQRPHGLYQGPTALERYSRRLYRWASRLESENDGQPQDIEWAIARGRLYLLQSRPITTMHNHNPVTGEWNDSYVGDYLWTNANFGEALPDVMTPFTWSVMQVYFRNNSIGIESEQFPMGGNIGGRLYMNASLLVSLADALGFSRQKTLRASSETFGRLPSNIDIPTVPLSRWWVLRNLVPHLLRRLRLVTALKRQIPTFIASAPSRATRFQVEIQACRTPAELLALWQGQLRACLDETCLMLAAGISDYKKLSRRLHMELEKLVDEADANALLSGFSTDRVQLASLGPLLGLARLVKGEMSRETYLQQYGHRGPSELELSKPRPAEDPQWLDRQLAEMERNPVDVMALLATQHARHQEAWERFKTRYPRRAKSFHRRFDSVVKAAHTREAIRSEVVRLFSLFRAFALRAGELTGLGDDVFFLSLDEIGELLAGKEIKAQIPQRRETHTRYIALPPYPAVINGRFNPFAWAADPHRRSDIFDSHAPVTGQTSTVVTGFAGAAGTVVGTVRCLDSPDEGDLLRPGEILVTTTTNIGWTPLFPRAAAIVTDVGAPLSHAAIVARELGIPAVVGCGNATMRLKTGDRVRVVGGQGIVEFVTGES